MTFSDTLLNTMTDKLTQVELSQFLISIFEHSPNVFFVKDGDGRYVIVNKAFEDYVQMPLASIIGKTDFDIMNHEDAVACVKSDQPALSMPNEINTSFENEHDASGDITAYLAVNKKVITTNMGDVLIGIATRVAT